MTTPHLRKSISRSPLRRGLLFIPFALVCFALSPSARAVSPKPDGGYPGQNTAEGDNALFSLTTGFDNTAIGYLALFSNTFTARNTAIGAEALYSNIIGESNTAIGAGALYSNTTGHNQTATGFGALFSNTVGAYNTADGDSALYHNTTGLGNTATGGSALASNTTGGANTANGGSALAFNTTGGRNIALGALAGFNLTTGSNNIDIGNEGVAGEANTIRIGTIGTQQATFITGISGTAITGAAVVVGANGQLGVAPSSQRFKAGIKPMDNLSEAILALKPVTFRYRHELDPEGMRQFGLVAEQVEKVNPDLVIRDAEGKVFTVRYEAVNAMLLNEFLKEHCRVKEQQTTMTQLKATVAKQEAAMTQQRKELRALTAGLKEQAWQIQKVSAQLELRKPGPQTLANN